MAKLQAGIIPVTPFQQNCTVLFDPDTMEGVIVDPGGDVEVILQTIKENDIKLKEIWLTHGHLDHAGGALELKEALGIDVIGPHQDDLPLLQNMEASAARFGASEMKVRNMVP
ncbi:MAG: MBL fold metallo-hydrolase, partial [Alphaproteobacteria bacterium]